MENAIKKRETDKTNWVSKKSRERLVNAWVIFEGGLWKYKWPPAYPKLSKRLIKITELREGIWEILQEKSRELRSEGKRVEFKLDWKTIQKSPTKPSKINRKEGALWAAVRWLSRKVECHADKKIEIPLCAKIIIDVSWIVILGS